MSKKLIFGYVNGGGDKVTFAESKYDFFGRYAEYCAFIYEKLEGWVPLTSGIMATKPLTPMEKKEYKDKILKELED